MKTFCDYDDRDEEIFIEIALTENEIEKIKGGIMLEKQFFVGSDNCYFSLRKIRREENAAC